MARPRKERPLPRLLERQGSNGIRARSAIGASSVVGNLGLQPVPTDAVTGLRCGSVGSLAERTVRSLSRPGRRRGGAPGSSAPQRHLPEGTDADRSDGRTPARPSRRPRPMAARAMDPAVGTTGDDLPSIEEVVKDLWSPDLRVRISAAWAAGQLGDPRAIQPLLGLLGTREPELKAVVDATLEKLAGMYRKASAGKGD